MGNSRVEPDARNTAKVMLHASSRPDRWDFSRVGTGAGRCDRAQVDCLCARFLCREVLPNLQSVLGIANFESTGKIIAASARNNQDRQAEFDKWPEMTVKGPVPAEQYDRISFTMCWQAQHPSDLGIILEWLQISRRRT